MDTDKFSIGSNVTNTSESQMAPEEILGRKSTSCNENDVLLFKEELGQFKHSNDLKFKLTKDFTEILNSGLGDGSEKAKAISKPEGLYGESLGKYASEKTQSNVGYMVSHDNLDKEAVSEIISKNLRESLSGKMFENPQEENEHVKSNLQPGTSENLIRHERSKNLRESLSGKMFENPQEENEHVKSNLRSDTSKNLIRHEREDSSKVSTSATLNPSVILSEQAVNSTMPTQISNLVDKEIQVSHSVFISQQIKDQIIDRILVSTGDLNEGKSVKVVLSPALLEATEINFQQNGKILNISFFSQNLQSLNFLQSNQLDLQAYLQDNLKQFEDVSVSVESDDEDVRNFTDGRSRNRQEYQNLDEDEQ